MKLRDQTKLKIKAIVITVFISGMIGMGYGGLTQFTKPKDLLVGFLNGIGISLIMAASYLFFLQTWLKRRSFTVAVLFSAIYSLMAIIAILTISHTLFGEFESLALNFRDLWESSKARHVILFSLLVSFLFAFLFRVSGLIGGRIFFSFFTGKYHQAIEEDRIFMFLDLKSSTTIAEKIGHLNFHNFINDFLFSISEAIVANRGDIYKYVGDEVIITWEMKEGLKDGRCLRVFFEAEDLVRHNKSLFENKYGIVPEFKAGLHCGKVVSGEIGDTKKEIAFLGDVINTTARIEAECNPRQRPLLISSDLFRKISLGTEYTYEKMGDIDLRGKMEKMELYTIKRTSRAE
jgi:adenylate cyclase